MGLLLFFAAAAAAVAVLLLLLLRRRLLRFRCCCCDCCVAAAAGLLSCCGLWPSSCGAVASYHTVAASRAWSSKDIVGASNLEVLHLHSNSICDGNLPTCRRGKREAVFKEVCEKVAAMFGECEAATSSLTGCLACTTPPPRRAMLDELLLAWSGC